jgi:hypothetical protein
MELVGIVLAGIQDIVSDCIISDHVAVLQYFDVCRTVVVDAVVLFWDLYTFEGEEEKIFLFDDIIEGNFV